MNVDLHTHSIASPDGALLLRDYTRMLERHQLDQIAITDHGRIDFAVAAQKVLGSHIIVGEEIKTTDGELIGLFLHTAIPHGLSPQETARQIKQQGGLVYVPHPFETVRSGISLEGLDSIAALIDIVETHNGRAVFQNRGKQAVVWAKTHKKSMAASSDAHGRIGWGNTYSIVSTPLTADTSTASLTDATYQTGTVGLLGITYPKVNRLRKWLRLGTNHH